MNKGLKALCLTGASLALAVSIAYFPINVGGNTQVNASFANETKLSISASEFLLPPAGKELKSQPLGGQIYQIDLTPIGNRVPLLLIHGGSAEFKPLCRWDKVVEHLNNDANFRKRYKIFLYRYNSKLSLSQSKLQLRAGLKTLSAAADNRPITIVALSMGGNLTQRALLDPDVDKTVGRVIAIATPFHGSPLFSENWFEYSLHRSLLIPWSRALHAFDYRFFFKRHLNYLKDLKWDDADLLDPNVDQSGSPLGSQEISTTAPDANTALAKINSTKNFSKQKFITYAGYLYNPSLMTLWRKRLEVYILWPYAIVRTRLLAQIGREHPALAWLNIELSQLKMNPNTDGLDSHAYKLNDGIAPVESAIWLPSPVMKKYPVLEEAHLKYVAEQCDVRLARTFKNIDHTSFLDGKPIKGQNLIQDEMHPEEKKRPLLNWLLNDLITDPSQKATGSIQ